MRRKPYASFRTRGRKVCTIGIEEMDKIDFAINNRWHLTTDKRLAESRWDDFERIAENRKVVIYGVGNGADWFFIKYKDKYDIDIVLDGNKDICSVSANENIYEMRQYKKYDNIVVQPPEFFFSQHPDSNDYVIVISSLMHFNEIAELLKKEGQKNFFSVLTMEANFRFDNGIVEESDWMSQYAIEVSDEVKKNKMVFTSCVDYTGNGRAIADQILRLGKDVELVWIVKERRDYIPDTIRQVLSREKRRMVYEMETAGILIDDVCSLPQWFRKRDGQTYIQVKHWGSLVLKVVSRDEGVFRGDKQQIAMHERDGKMMDYVITGSDLDTKACCSGFAFDKEVWQIGSPRSDVLFHPDAVIKKIKSKYSIEGKKVLLYAPTFRYTELKPEATFINLDYQKVKETLEEKFGGEWVIFLRLHPAVAKESKKIRHPLFVIDVSEYPEGTELVCASNAMITDYSSIMFEAALIYIPVFLYVPDMEDYLLRQRALHLRFEDMPFSIAETNDDLMQSIIGFDKKSYDKETREFLRKFNVCDDGHAAERAVNNIIDLMENKSG